MTDFNAPGHTPNGPAQGQDGTYDPGFAPNVAPPTTPPQAVYKPSFNPMPVDAEEMNDAQTPPAPGAVKTTTIGPDGRFDTTRQPAESFIRKPPALSRLSPGLRAVVVDPAATERAQSQPSPAGKPR